MIFERKPTEGYDSYEAQCYQKKLWIQKSFGDGKLFLISSDDTDINNAVILYLNSEQALEAAAILITFALGVK